MSKKKYKLDLSSIRTIEDLTFVLNSLGMVYTVDTSKYDPVFESFKRMGIVREERGEDNGISVTCDICSHGFKTSFVNERVKCPNCGNKTYVEPE